MKLFHLLPVLIFLGLPAQAQIGQATKPVPTPRPAMTLKGNNFGWLDQKLAQIGAQLDQINTTSLAVKGGASGQSLMRAVASCDAVNFEFNKRSFSAVLSSEQRSDAELKTHVSQLCADLHDLQAGTSMSLKELQIQMKLQQANRSYSALSNIMKVRHDTAKSMIQNVRG